MVSKYTAPTRVFIVDDHPLVVDALQALIGHDETFVISGSAGTGAAALAAITQTVPDIVLLDLVLPDIPGDEVIRRVLSAAPRIKVLVLTASRSTDALGLAMAAGASGVITKNAVGDELMNALRKVAMGLGHVDPLLAEAPMADDEPAGALSRREYSVLRLVAQGMASKQIASELSIGLKTVETHKARALAKLKLSNRADIFRFARSQGWLGEE